MRYWFGIVAVAVLTGCGNGKISSDEEAELAYIGLDQAVERAMRLGLKGFSEASSANIDPQSEDGDVSGTMTVTGQADQGASANKGLRLDVALEEYADLVEVHADGDDDDDDDAYEIVYDTDPAELPYLDLQLKGIPDGTVEGSFDGTFLTSGDLEGEVTLSLQISGDLEPDPEIEGGVRRVEGSTTVTGTATNESGGEFEVDIEI